MYFQAVWASGIHRVSHSSTKERAFVGVFRIIQLQIVLFELCKAYNFVRFTEFRSFRYKERGMYTHYKANVRFLGNSAQ